MRLTIALAAMIFLFAAASALARDPACSNHEGVHINRLNPWAASALGVLKACIPLYCGGKNKHPQTPTVLKETDQAISVYHAELVNYGSKVTEYQKLCKKLSKMNCVACPELDQFRNLGFELQDAYEDLGRAENALLAKADPLQEAVERVEQDNACFTQAANAMAMEVDLRKSLADRFRNTRDCRKN